VFMSLALASFGSYVHYDENNGSGGNSDWIPLLCVLIFTIAFSLGEFHCVDLSIDDDVNFFEQEFHQYRGC
jgi:hypothetical protein